MRRKASIWILASAVVAAGLAALAVFVTGTGEEEAPPSEEKRPVERDGSRRTAAGLEEAVERLRARGGGFPGELRAQEASGEAREHFERQAGWERRQTPSAAVENAREKLEAIDEQLRAATDEAEIRHLENRKRMVESVLKKLEAIAER
ncbi:MAG: hypothetical protein R6V85_03505 [Polyangia bacterium]